MTMQVAALAAVGVAGIYLFSQQGKKPTVKDAVNLETDTPAALGKQLPAAQETTEVKTAEIAPVISALPTPIVRPAVHVPAIIVPDEEPVAAGWSIELTNNMGQIQTGHGRVFTARVMLGNRDVSSTVDMVFYRPDGSYVYPGAGARALLTPDVPGLWTVKIRAGGGGMGRQERDIPFRVALYLPFGQGL